MNQEDKILVTALIDGEISPEEKTLADELIRDNPEAKEFYETSKVILNQLNSELRSPETLAMEARLNRFALDQMEEKPVFSWGSLVNLSLPNLNGILSINNGLVASLAFTFALVLSPSLMQQNISLDSNGFYQEEIFTLVTRGESEDKGNALVNAYTDAYVLNLIQSGKQAGEFKSEEGLVIQIAIDEAFKRKGVKYYSGQIQDNTGNQTKFIASISEKSLITYTH